MNSMEGLTVIVLRKDVHPKRVTNGEAFRLIRPLFESNGLEVGDPIDMADGFLFTVRPHTGSWNDTERCAVMTGLSCLGSFGFAGYIAQEALKALRDEVRIDGGTVALGLIALAATAAIAAGGIFACVKGVRAVGRRLCAGKAIRAR